MLDDRQMSSISTKTTGVASSKFVSWRQKRRDGDGAGFLHEVSVLLDAVEGATEC